MVLVKHWGWGLKETVQCVSHAWWVVLKVNTLLLKTLKRIELKVYTQNKLKLYVKHSGTLWWQYFHNICTNNILKYRHNVYINFICCLITVKLREEAKQHNSRINSYNACWLRKEKKNKWRKLQCMKFHKKKN